MDDATGTWVEEDWKPQEQAVAGVTTSSPTGPATNAAPTDTTTTVTFSASDDSYLTTSTMYTSAQPTDVSSNPSSPLPSTPALKRKQWYRHIRRQDIADSQATQADDSTDGDDAQDTAYGADAASTDASVADAVPTDGAAYDADTSLYQADLSALDDSDTFATDTPAFPSSSLSDIATSSPTSIPSAAALPTRTPADSTSNVSTAAPMIVQSPSGRHAELPSADCTVGFIGLFFSTFFGGHTSDWATPKDQYTYFKGFKMWVN